MNAYRAYQLDAAGRIANATWLEADNDEQAEALALRLCGPGVPSVELWQGTRRVAVLSCGEPSPAIGRTSSTDTAAPAAKPSIRLSSGRAVEWLRLRTQHPRGRGGRPLAPGAAPSLRR